MRLGDRQFRRVETGVFRRHAVQVDVQTVCQLSDCDTHASGAEVIGFLNQFRHLGTTEETLDLTLLGCVSFLNLAAAGLQGSLCMLFAGTRGTTYTIASGTSAKKENHITCRRALTTHCIGLNGSYYSAHFQTLCYIRRVIDLPHMSGCQTDLVAVGRIARSGLAGDNLLRQFARQRLAHGGVDVSGSGHTHRLIDVRTAGQRITDSAAETSTRATERLYLRRMVVGLVLELQQPPLCLTIHIHIDEDGTSVILFAHLHIVQQAFLL